MRAAGVRRGYQFLSVAQQFDSHRDFKKYDYIIVMDDDNYRDISALDDSKNYENKLRKMVSYSKSFSDVGVPDPYYGGAEGFEYVLDMLEEGCAQLLESLLAELKD
jgi:protein-tyrosine phosphatase